MKGSSLVNEILLRQRLTELGSIASWAPHILSGLERFIAPPVTMISFASILSNTRPLTA
jgi:hypothetical protein